MRKVDTCLFIPNTLICEAYLENFLFWEHFQYNIDKVLRYFREYGNNYNWEHPKGESVYEFLGLGIKTLDDDEF